MRRPLRPERAGARQAARQRRTRSAARAPWGGPMMLRSVLLASRGSMGGGGCRGGEVSSGACRPSSLPEGAGEKSGGPKSVSGVWQSPHTETTERCLPCAIFLAAASALVAAGFAAAGLAAGGDWENATAADTIATAAITLAVTRIRVMAPPMRWFELASDPRI